MKSFYLNVIKLPMLDLDQSGKLPSTGLHSTTRRGDAPACVEPIEGPFQLLCSCLHGVSSALSLSQWMRVFVYLWRCGKNLGQILRELRNVSEIATNHWVFLRCDWPPISR